MARILIYDSQGELGSYVTGSDGITLSKTLLGGGKEGSAKLAAVMSHEGTHADGNRIEAIAHIQGKMTYEAIKAVFELRGDAEFSAGMIAAILDPASWAKNTGDTDYWYVKNNGDIFDDGNDGVISFEDGRAAISTNSKGKQGSLEEYLGLESGEGYSLLMKDAGFVYDGETKTWTGSKTISAAAIKDLIAEGIISADVIAEPASQTDSAVSAPESKQSFWQSAWRLWPARRGTR